ncbi:UNVERIFIED_CONTAM: hypothetical protein Slati_2917800 [Sesamum latifolium]|uniref:Uncharacterized protein n=1 Tax=Sesamum latifolium TaxID=2727402 RepID=A0AAW2VER1_9LAMI
MVEDALLFSQIMRTKCLWSPTSRAASMTTENWRIFIGKELGYHCPSSGMALRLIRGNMPLMDILL